MQEQDPEDWGLIRKDGVGPLTEDFKKKSLQMVSTVRWKPSPGIEKTGQNRTQRKIRSDPALGMSNLNSPICL